MPDRADEPAFSSDHPATPSRQRGLYGQRPSKSHDDFIRKEFSRIAAMSARERMIEALVLDRELAPLLVPKSQPGPESKPGPEGETSA